MSECFSCRNKDADLLCSACEKVKYCSEECKKKHWKKHKSSCRLTKVCVIENEQIKERDYALLDLSESAGWRSCQVPSLLGVPLIFKPLESKRMRSNKLAQILMVKPDSLLQDNEIYEALSNGQDEESLYVETKDGFSELKPSDNAWRADLSDDKHGILMFARQDKKDLSSEILIDLFNYIYDIMEFYSEKSIQSLKIVKHMCRVSSFDIYRSKITAIERRKSTKYNLKKYPNPVSNSKSSDEDVIEINLMEMLFSQYLHHLIHHC